MASFIDTLKAASSTAKANTPVTLELDNIPVAYADESFSRSSKYEWYDQYSDDNYSFVDELKNVKVDGKQVNLTQEENSQVIPFEMNRYYDGFDLASNAFIQLHYVNVEGQEGFSAPINVTYSNSRIRFYWLVTGDATALAGKLKFEVIATGQNEKGNKYVWRTKPNEEINILESLAGNGVIEPSSGWNTYIETINNKILAAQASADEAKAAAAQAEQSAAGVDDKIANATTSITNSVLENIADELANYYTKTEVDSIVGIIQTNVADLQTQFKSFDGLAALNIEYSADTDTITYYNGKSVIKAITLDMTPSSTWINSYNTLIDSKISAANEELKTSLQTEFDEKLAAIDVSDQFTELEQKIADEYYKKTQVDEKLNEKADSTTVAGLTTKVGAVESTANSNKTSLSAISAKIAEIEETMNDVNTDPTVKDRLTYEPTTGVFTHYEVTEDDDGNELTRELVEQFTIVGGSGGGASTSTTITIDRITNSPLTLTKNDKAIIKYSFKSVDSSGDDTGEGTAVWKIGTTVVKTTMAVQGENTVDLTEYVNVGTNKVVVTITDSAGTVSVKNWTVQVVDVRLESTFDDSYTYPVGTVSFAYTPYGSIAKTVHFILDGVELPSVNTSASGIPMSYELPSKPHGSHLLEAYISATINEQTIETAHIYKDILYYDETSHVPVIGCTATNITAKQYDNTNIKYSVYDPHTETPTVTLSVDGKEVSTLTLQSATQVWQFKSSEIGEHTLTITCRDTVKTIHVKIEKLDIDVTPVTANLAFDFNPSGRSNNDANKLWSDKDVAMTVSENFDWINGGYQIDENGDQYFCVKSGTTATINYNLFADDPKKNGKEFKVIFKTTKVRNRATSFITCMNSDIGLDMKIESANVYSSNANLYSPYCENDIIEFEFNINKNTDIPMVLTYEDGVGNRPMLYTADASFMQPTPQPITIGSPDCDVYIYRMKAYSASLSDRDILSNFIADARNAEEMIARHNRNQIYDENGVLNPEILAEKCSDLRVILVDAPWFTNDKSNKVDGTTIRMIYKNGDPVLDNWTCTGAKHSGQGTSSNEYGYAGRNLDLIMDGDTALFTLGDGVTTSKTITLTRDSVPTDYLNVKVNIASSENENNAQFARRYNEYNPFKRTAKLKDNKVKDTMEFYNCVVFIRENNADISTHREFTDTNYHFYAIGNVGDSKKTDDTRVNDKNDPKEHIIEITDYNVALAEFPTGKADAEGNKIICPVSEWKTGNAAYDYLYASYKYKDGEFKSFGSESYEFRYEKKGITSEERQANIDSWREAYKFVVTSDDETFVSDFEKYFVKDSILYYYLFTERYLSVDNRAKNTFIHYGKVWYTSAEAKTFKETNGVEIESKYIDDTQGAFNGGYRYDLVFFYDSDTTLGIDNTGKLVLTYGQEDTDFYVDGDPSSTYIYRAAESTFFCRVRDLFSSELQAMFVDRENANAWSADGLISQWDKAQFEFPEELWRLDIQRKYLRTYQGISIDNSIAGTANPRFLTEMLNGRKRYQRRMFERNQELYMATKYFGNRATQDQIMMRFNNPVGVAIKPNFTLKITPYSNMYIGVKFGNVTPINMRAKAGVEYTIPYSLETADITLIYGASFIQAIGDLSKCYVGDNDFSKASRLQSLVIGSDAEGYSNTYMTKISLGNNDLLEYLDIRNTAGLNSVVDLSQCNNLLELRAEGSGATGVIFANGGKLQKAYLPDLISMTLKNLNNLNTFQIAGYTKLQTLIVENTPFINTYKVVTAADALRTLRLIGIDWGQTDGIEDDSILKRLMTLSGIDASGYNTPKSILSGNIHIPVIGEQALLTYNTTWQDLVITHDTLIKQYSVTFMNDDGTVLDVQYVNQGEKAVDPIKRSDNPIPTPTKESTVSTYYTFNGWDSGFVAVFGNQVITATYTEGLRSYNVKYVSKGTTLYEKMAEYGSNVLYVGDTPTYTAEEVGYKYYLFDRWDKSGFVDGDKTINAIYDSCSYVAGYFDNKEFADLRPVEIYALTMLEQSKVLNVNTILTDGDNTSFTMGHNFDYDDIQSVEIIKEKTEFNGSNYVETNIKLFDEDRDFVLAIDYQFKANKSNSSANVSGATMAECYQSSQSTGFKLQYSTNYSCTWGTASTVVANAGTREMLVIRHIKGDNNLYVYTSGFFTGAANVQSVELERNRNTILDSTLVLGASKPEEDTYENNVVGTIYWCKLWYADLGSEACEKLAMWTKEKCEMEVCGFKRFYLSDGSNKRCSFSLLATQLISRKAAMNSASDSNAGGWAKMSLNTFLNTRMYDSLPNGWKQLVKKVQVMSSSGSQSSEITTSDCYITIPSILEVDPSFAHAPYSNEIYGGASISYMTTNDARKRAFEDGTYADYWTRSPNVDNYVSNDYFWYVDSNGSTSGYGNPYYSNYGILIELSI